MILAFESLLPSFLLIALGFALVRTPLFPPSVWEGVERLNYYVMFPLLLTVTLIRADLSGKPVGAMAAALALAVLIVAALMALTRPLWMRSVHVDGPAFSSHFQGAIRWQTSVGLAVAAGLYGRDGLALAAIGVAAVIPLVNVLSVIALTTSVEGPKPGVTKVLGEIARNPLIIATVAGALINVADIPVYAPVLETLDLLGRGALGIGLMLVGAGLDMRTLAPRADLAAVVVVKLVVMPALMVGIAVLFGVGGMALAVVAIAGASPTSSSAYVLARRLGGDAVLMSGIITAQMIVAFATLPFWIWLVGGTAVPPT